MFATACVSAISMVASERFEAAAQLSPASVKQPASQPHPVRRLYRVHDKDKVGFIDRTGKIIIDFDRFPPGTFVGDFSEGLASVCFPNPEQKGCSSTGYIDQTGKMVIALRFKSAHEFSGGLALVATETASSFIDPRGAIAFTLSYKHATSFHEGLAAVLTPDGWGFIDRTGTFISKDRYKRVERFSEGLAAVASWFGETAKYGFINRKGETAIPLRFDPPLGFHGYILDLGRFSEGLAPVRVGNLYGYINKKGRIVIAPQFLNAAEFSEGLASVITPAGQTGYIDHSGRFAIKLRSGGGYSFSEGLAAWAGETESGMKIGYIDRRGKVIIEPKFDGAFAFVDGVAQVHIRETVTTAAGPRLETRIGYIDKTGRYVWEPQ